MADDTTINNNEELQGELTTANDLAELLNGNYRTVRRILERMSAEGKIKEGSLIRANRSTPAYYLNNSAKKLVQAELKAIRNGKKRNVLSNNANVNTKGVNASNINNIGLSSHLYNNNANDIANVKLYEVMKDNNELSNKVQELEKAVTEKEMQRVKTESELYCIKADLKLITDKSTTFEGEVANLNQQMKEKDKEIKNKDKLISYLSSTLLIIITVISCYAVFSHIN